MADDYSMGLNRLAGLVVLVFELGARANPCRNKHSESDLNVPVLDIPSKGLMLAP